MTTALRLLVDVVVLFVVAWSLIFGGIGALLSRTRGGTASSGLALGMLLGPIGWTVVWLRTRTTAIVREVELAGEPDSDWSVR